jgi:shikimate kinase
MAHVWLIGMMGSGKSTVGRLVAEHLDRPFYDTDVAVESAAGMTIMEIFERFGEDGFRERERTAVAQIADETPGVVATGGGAILDPVSVETMGAAGTVVLLAVDPDVLIARVAEDGDRPLLLDGIERAIRSIDRARSDRYRTSADVVVDASRPIETVAEEVEAICNAL